MAYELMDPGQIGMNALAAFERGQGMKRQEQAQGALSAYAVTPDAPGAFETLAKYHPELAIQEKGRRAQAEGQAQAAARAQVMDVARLLSGVSDEATYQQARAAAQQLGLDVGAAPANYDPNWVAQQKWITKSFLDEKDDRLSGIGQELIDAGYKPGTPEYTEAARGVISNKYASEYVDEGGNMRRRSGLQLGGAPVGPQPPPEGAVAELRANPASAAQFDEVFGPGSAAKVLGGQPGGAAPFSVAPSAIERITMMSESGGNPNALSPKGARGLMQVMPGTSRDPGFGIRPSDGSQREDVRVGQEYLGKMRQRYGGDLAKMWAAYNWGPGNLDKALAKHGENWLQHAPAETRNYVARNMRAARGR